MALARSQKIALGLTAAWGVFALTAVWWLSVTHVRGALRVTRGGTEEVLHARDCFAGTTQRPSVTGTKVELDHGYDLLVDQSEERPRVVLRVPPDRAPVVVLSTQCTTFEKRLTFYTPSWIYKESRMFDGHVTLKCTSSDGVALEGSLHFSRCIKSASGMVGEK